MRIAFAVFLIIHALAHGVGFLNQAFLVGVEDPSANRALLLSRFEMRHPLVRSLGVLWLLAGAGFLAAGIGVLQEADWAVPLLVAATALSAVQSVVWVREAPLGPLANAVVIAVLAVPDLSDRMLP